LDERVRVEGTELIVNLEGLRDFTGDEYYHFRDTFTCLGRIDAMKTCFVARKTTIPHCRAGIMK